MDKGFLLQSKYDSTLFEALVLLKQKYFPLPTRAITLYIYVCLDRILILGSQLWLGYRKHILSVCHSFCSIHDFKNELSLDRGRLKVLDLILTTPIWWWVVRPPNYVKKYLRLSPQHVPRGVPQILIVKTLWFGGEGVVMENICLRRQSLGLE